MDNLPNILLRAAERADFSPAGYDNLYYLACGLYGLSPSSFPYSLKPEDRLAKIVSFDGISASGKDTLIGLLAKSEVISINDPAEVLEVGWFDISSIKKDKLHHVPWDAIESIKNNPP